MGISLVNRFTSVEKWKNTIIDWRSPHIESPHDVSNFFPLHRSLATIGP